MTVHPRRDADHENILLVLAFLALDGPPFAEVIRSLVIELYGASGVSRYDAHLRACSPAPLDPSTPAYPQTGR